MHDVFFKGRIVLENIIILHKRCLQKERETVKRHLHFTLIPFFQIPFTLFSYSRIFDELKTYLNAAAKELMKNNISVADNIHNYIGDALRQIVTEADNIGEVTILNSNFLYIYHIFFLNKDHNSIFVVSSGSLSVSFLIRFLADSAQ